MEPKKFEIRCAVHLFLITDNKILIEKRCNREYGDGQYDVIASHILGGEDAISAIIRTAKTEVNIDVKTEDLEIVQVMHQNSDGIEYINYFFRADKFYGEINNNETEFCENLEWIDFKYPIDNMMEYINEAIKNYIESPENKFTFYGWTHLIK